MAQPLLYHRKIWSILVHATPPDHYYQLRVDLTQAEEGLPLHAFSFVIHLKSIYRTIHTVLSVHVYLQSVGPITLLPPRLHFYGVSQRLLKP
ncbi:hypothetical protein M408DRAFT_215974 [Serendipita vermifera MAFF 305830]|uniref:Uncharacterized protein n=1 Tax=Serendipita vermifera MAFF 305830 TaxID=933852 RepID=A0A0C3BJK4_SERVB|nr:hypothetical protein M408DRAFT_215974 [Serendipita vermifera MAFF 305830]